MVERRPLVRIGGKYQQLPAGDTLPGGDGVTSVGMSVPTGLSVSGSPVTTSGTLALTYSAGYRGYTDAENTKLSGIAAGATVGATWGSNLYSIPANISSWASSGLAPTDVVTRAGTETISGNKEFTGNSNRFSGSSGLLIGTGNAQLRADSNAMFVRFGTTDYVRIGTDGFLRSLSSGIESAGVVVPSYDGGFSTGSASRRWNVVYAATGTINTSDAREKTPVRKLTVAELAAAAELGGEIGIYRWLATIEDKGDAARLHVGMTVQLAIEIMRSHGLEPFAYGFICHDEWAEQPEVIERSPDRLDDDGNIVELGGEYVAQPYRAAGDRYSFRMDELLAFIARGLAHRLSAIEQRMVALEAGCP